MRKHLIDNNWELGEYRIESIDALTTHGVICIHVLDEHHIAIGRPDNSVLVWNLDSQKCLQRFKREGINDVNERNIIKHIFGLDSSMIASSYSDGLVVIWYEFTGTRIKHSCMNLRTLEQSCSTTRSLCIKHEHRIRISGIMNTQCSFGT